MGVAAVALPGGGRWKLPLGPRLASEGTQRSPKTGHSSTEASVHPLPAVFSPLPALVYPFFHHLLLGCQGQHGRARRAWAEGATGESSPPPPLPRRPRVSRTGVIATASVLLPQGDPGIEGPIGFPGPKASCCPPWPVGCGDKPGPGGAGHPPHPQRKKQSISIFWKLSLNRAPGPRLVLSRYSPELMGAAHTHLSPWVQLTPP